MERGLVYYARRAAWWLKFQQSLRDVTIPTANGLLSCSNKDWLIGKHLYTHRNYEFEFIGESMRFLREAGMLSNAADTVADIGANIGMVAIALLRESHFRRALAIEPSPASFRLLQKNVRQNDLEENIECFAVALSSEDAELEFEIAEDNSGDSRVRKSNDPGPMNEQCRKTVTVPSRSFDSFLADGKADTEAIDLFWIDIQGHEGHFFKGAEGFFRNRKIPVVNEFWGYGIGRSGVSRDEYVEIVTGIFTDLYVYTSSGYERRPIAEIDSMFDRYSEPRQIANIILY